MKKYLMCGMAAMAMTAALTSCSHEETAYTQAEIDQAIYDQAFLKYIGGRVAGNQDWGFSSASQEKARTRAAATYGWELSEDFEAEFDKGFIDYVTTALPEEVSAGSKLNNYEFESKGEFKFSIVYTQTSNEDQMGYYYYNPATQTIADRTEKTFISNVKEELGNLLQYGQDVSYGDGKLWTGVQSGTGTGYWDWGATTLRAKVFTVNVPAGYRVGFFLKCKEGYTLYSNSSLNNTDEATGNKFYYSAVVDKTDDAFLVGFEDWYYPGNNSAYDNHVADCNDVVIAINQKTSTPPVVVDKPNEKTQKADLRIIAEDLSATEASDFDFNDIVLDVVYDESNAKLILQAAGGTLPLRIAGNDEWEVHKLYDVDTNVMVNTGASGAKGATKAPVEIEYGKGVTTPEEAKNIKLEVFKNNTWEELTAPKGEPACKLAVGVDFKILPERASIKDEYELFVEWATENQFTSSWWQ